jgi:hypothetical protein
MDRLVEDTRVEIRRFQEAVLDWIIEEETER